MAESNTLCETAMHLSLHDHWVNNIPAVIDGTKRRTFISHCFLVNIYYTYISA
mgnify:CR=1 FL=1